MLPLIAGVVLLFLSIILGFYNSNKSNYTVYLFSFYMITSAMIIVYFILFSGRVHSIIPYFYIYYDPFFFLQGVFLYFYVKSNLDQQNILVNKRNYLHFLPILLPLIGNFRYFFLEKADKLKYIASFADDPNKLFSLEIPGVYFNQIESYISRSTSLLIYSTICVILLIRKKPFQHLDSIPKEKRAKKYQLIYIWILCIIQILWAMALLAVFFQSFTFDNSNRSKSFDYTISFLELNMFVQIVSLLVFPNILYGLKPREKKPDRLKASQTNSDDLISDEILQKAEMLFEYIENEKPYLDPKFNKVDLTIQLKLSPKEINEILELVIKKSFPAYKNTLRVNHAKKLLSEGGAEKMTMDGIGFSSGFPSRSSFYSIFKEETGLTPIQFIESFSE